MLSLKSQLFHVLSLFSSHIYANLSIHFHFLTSAGCAYTRKYWKIIHANFRVNLFLVSKCIRSSPKNDNKKRFYFVTQVETMLNLCPDIFTYFLNESDSSLCFAT